MKCTVCLAEYVTERRTLGSCHDVELLLEGTGYCLYHYRNVVSSGALPLVVSLHPPPVPETERLAPEDWAE